MKVYRRLAYFCRELGKRCSIVPFSCFIRHKKWDFSHPFPYIGRVWSRNPWTGSWMLLSQFLSQIRKSFLYGKYVPIWWAASPVPSTGCKIISSLLFLVQKTVRKRGTSLSVQFKLWVWMCKVWVSVAYRWLFMEINIFHICLHQMGPISTLVAKRTSTWLIKCEHETWPQHALQMLQSNSDMTYQTHTMSVNCHELYSCCGKC